jgi:hypothetical protein
MICLAFASSVWACVAFLHDSIPACIGAGVGSLFFAFVAFIKHRDAEESWQRYFRALQTGDWE